LLYKRPSFVDQHCILVREEQMETSNSSDADGP